MNLYETYMDLWKRGSINAGFSPRIPDYANRLWLEQFQKALPKTTEKNFLDIGAGDGRLSQLLLHTYSPQGTALEVQVNPESWEHILKQFPLFELKIGLLQNIMGELVTKKVFSFILLAEVFEHIHPADVPQFLIQLKPLLARDGRIFLTTPNRVGQGPAETSDQWHERQPWGHWKHYTLQELTDIFKNAGFTITHHTLECNHTKTLLYNKWFYPISRLDGRLLSTKKLPNILKNIYKHTSLPFIWIVKAIFWALAQVVYAVEKRFNTEANTETVMITLKHAE